MVADGWYSDEGKRIANRQCWLDLKKHLVQAEKVSLKLFGGCWLSLDEKQRNDLTIWLGKVNIDSTKCPDFDSTASALFIQSVW